VVFILISSSCSTKTKGFRSAENQILFIYVYFWSTKEQQEIDYLEVVDGILRAFEFKWKAKANHRITKKFTRAYPNRERRLFIGGL
jgi:hypothetical protein